MQTIRVLAGVLVAPMLVVAGASTTAAQTPISSCWPQDTNPPVVLDATLSATTVDSTGGPTTIAVDVHAKDLGGPVETSGLDSATVRVTAERAEQEWDSTPLALTSPDHLTGSITVPQYTLPGTYRASISLRDEAGNYGSARPAFTVTNASPDTVRPVISALEVSPTSLDTAVANQVTVTAVVTDADSAVRRVAASIDGSKKRHELTPTSVPDTFAATVSIPVRPGEGTTRKRIMVEAWDAAGNWAWDSKVVTVTQPADPDPGKPEIRSVRATPTSIDVRRDGATVTLKARVIDGTGVTRVWAVRDYTLRGYPQEPVELTLATGTVRDGIWRGSFEVSPCDQIAGKTLPIRLRASDRSGATRTLDPGAVVKVSRINRIQPRGAVTRPNQVPPKGPLVMMFRRGSGSDRVPVPVAGVSKKSIRIVELHYFDPPYSDLEEGDEVRGSWRCFSRPSGGRAHRTNCAGDRVVRAEFTPTTKFSRRFRVQTSPPGKMPVTDRQGNPLTVHGGCSKCRTR